MKPMKPIRQPNKKTSKYFIIVVLIFAVRNYVWNQKGIPDADEASRAQASLADRSTTVIDNSNQETPRSLETESFPSTTSTSIIVPAPTETIMNTPKRTSAPSPAQTQSPTFPKLLSVQQELALQQQQPTAKINAEVTTSPIRVESTLEEMESPGSSLLTAASGSVESKLGANEMIIPSILESSSTDINAIDGPNEMTSLPDLPELMPVDNSTNHTGMENKTAPNDVGATDPSFNVSHAVGSDPDESQVASLSNTTDLEALPEGTILNETGVELDTPVGNGRSGNDTVAGVTGIEVTTNSTDDDQLSTTNSTDDELLLDRNATLLAEGRGGSVNTTELSLDFNSTTNSSDFEELESKNETEESESIATTPFDNADPSEGTVIPNVLIAGAQKGGTTSIARYLNWTQSACFSKPSSISQGEGKESHFFDHWQTYNGSGLPYYHKIFQHCEDQPLVVDATPEFMRNAERIYETYQEQGTLDSLKIIFTLREPVSREISWYNHRLRDCQTQNYAKKVCNPDGSPKPFSEIANKELVWRLESEKLGHMYSSYAVYLELFFQLFERKQILVLSYDELQGDKESFLDRIHKFLDLPGKPEALPHVNSDFGAHEDPPCDVQRALDKRFKPLNEKLYSLLEANPGPDSEERPFRKFHNKCFDEQFASDEPDPFVKKKNDRSATAPISSSKHIIPKLLVSGGHAPLVGETIEFLRQFRDGCGPGNETMLSSHFFSNNKKFKQGINYYQSMFDHCMSNASLIVDGSPDLIMFPRRVREIYEAQGTAKKVRFIFSLREPVRREVTAFQNRARTCSEEPNLRDAVCQGGTAIPFDQFAERHVFSKIANEKLDYQGGLYDQYLKLWFEVWDRKQILLLSYEESESDPKAYVTRIRRFLGIKSRAKRKFRLAPAKVDDSVEAPPCETEKRLSSLFEPFNNNLYKLLEENPGTKAEQTPFPIFEHSCQSRQ